MCVSPVHLYKSAIIKAIGVLMPPMFRHAPCALVLGLAGITAAVILLLVAGVIASDGKTG
jgi:hypothetical protein